MHPGLWKAESEFVFLVSNFIDRRHRNERTKVVQNTMTEIPTPLLITSYNTHPVVENASASGRAFVRNSRIG